MPKICSVDGCDRKHYCKGFCSKHYQNWFKHGDPLHSEKSGPLYWLESHANHDGDECLVWPFAKLTNGYGTVQVRDGRKRIASRVMCELAHGEPNDPKMQSAHSCGNGHLGCVNPKHLRWATVKENAADKKLHGTHLYGSKAPWSKLSDDQVRYILQDGKDESADILADRFGVTKWAIYNIRQGRRWTGLDG